MKLPPPSPAGTAASRRALISSRDTILPKPVAVKPTRSDVRAPLRAVDRDARAADPACPLGTEEGDHAGHLLGPAEPAQRDVPLDEIGHPFRVGLPAAVPPASREEDGT